MAPVFHRLNAEVEEVQGVPTELNGMLLDGQLDLAPISSIEYARHASQPADPAADVRLLRGRGRLDSARLSDAVPADPLDCGDAGERHLGRAPEGAAAGTRCTCRSIVERRRRAKLLISDAALRSAFEDPTPHYDLGKLWLDKTGLPMVFAVWAAPEPVADGVAEFEHSLVASVRLARAEPDVLAHEASDRYGYPAGYLARYFEKLRYSFGPRERAGLYTFFEMARDVGQLEHVPELRFVSPSATRV